MEKIQGAEALVIIKNKSVEKNRIKKRYRLSILDDRLRKQRTKKEARLLQKSILVIPVPKILEIRENLLVLEKIKGKRLSENLDKNKKAEKICIQIGRNVAKLHDIDVIHGDLTTSNMLLVDKNIYFIDFGLGFESNKNEDKATDIHLMKESFEAKHYKKANRLWKSFLEGYKISKNFKEVIKRLSIVEKRGRYKNQI